jgi:hypothetical protein
VAASTADITTFKILINITLSTKDAEMMMMDIKNYYLGTPLPRYEYMRLTLSIIPDEIITKNNLRAISMGDWVYLKIHKRHVRPQKIWPLGQKKCSKDWPLTTTTRPGTPQYYGYIKQDQLHLNLLWITLQ